jgi:ubiquinone/menaquinone biosynthesis C-methylase UbiE
MPAKLQRWTQPEACCDPEWEAAYARFETPAQEERKFLGRLRRLGVADWSRDLHVVDIFCGRGGGLRAWTTLGFQRLEGVDLSESLLLQYSGDAQLYVGDCRRMELPDASRDVVCVQGGLHHLPTVPADLDAVIGEVHRVLRPGGRFVIVEPWLTPFLRFVHALCRRPLMRRVSPKLDALACMISREERTYLQWLSMPEVVRAALGRGFETQHEECRLGKLMWVGLRRPGTDPRPVRPPSGLAAGAR